MDFYAQQIGKSTDIGCPPLEEHPNLGIFEAPSGIFRSIDGRQLIYQYLLD